MIDNPSRSPSLGLESSTHDHEALTGLGMRSVQHEALVDPAPASLVTTVPTPLKMLAGMTPEQTRAYIQSTKERASRKKPRPSLTKYEDFLRECVKGKAVMRQVFDDLVAADPAVLAEFGPDGHRAFNACVKRMV